jgi:hypothetical protein
MLLVLQAEARKSELEMLLSVNLVRRQQELQAQLLASDTQGLMEDLAVKRQELKDAKAAVDETTRQLKCKLHRCYGHCQLFGCLMMGCHVKCRALKLNFVCKLCANERMPPIDISYQLP